MNNKLLPFDDAGLSTMAHPFLIGPTSAERCGQTLHWKSSKYFLTYSVQSWARGHVGASFWPKIPSSFNTRTSMLHGEQKTANPCTIYKAFRGQRRTSLPSKHSQNYEGGVTLGQLTLHTNIIHGSTRNQNGALFNYVWSIALLALGPHLNLWLNAGSRYSNMIKHYHHPEQLGP